MKVTYKSKLITLEVERVSNILICKCIHLNEKLYKFLYEKGVISFYNQYKISFTTGKYFEFVCNIMYIPPKCNKNFIFTINCDCTNTAKFYMKNLLLALHNLNEEYVNDINKFHTLEQYIKNLTKYE